MPRILVVESNPKIESDRLEALTGQALGPLYAATLEGLCNDVETVVISPYDGDETPDLSGFDGIAFTGSFVEWNTDVERAAPLAAVMRTGFAAGLPTIGSCTYRDEVVRLPEGAVRLAGNHHSNVQAFAIDRGGVDFWGMQYHPEFSPSYIGRYLRLSGQIATDVADDLEAAETDESAAARMSTTLQDQNAPRRTIELANWLARLLQRLVTKSLVKSLPFR